jgi:predicted nucleic acid-binding protein
MRVYFDSSAFAKRYIDEAGTIEVLDWCEHASELAVSVLLVPEVISAFRRLLRQGRIDEGQYRLLKDNLLVDIGDALICDMTPEVIAHAVRVIESHALRGMHAIHGMGAIHIGAAIACTAEVFVSADARQCAAAQVSGLNVIAL